MTEVPVYRLKWRWLPYDRYVRNLVVGIVASDEPPSPEYLIVMTPTQDGVSEIARCDRFAPGALARMLARQEEIVDLLEVADGAWFDDEYQPSTAAPDKPG